MFLPKFSVTVPATSANIGAGFDCMGLALNIYNTLEFSEAEGIHIETDADLPKDKSNLVVRSMINAYEKVGRKFEGVYLKQSNNIPKTSGLGSSAACIVGGVTAANILMNEPLSRQEVINLCSALDGHPDNVVPALIGGVTAGVISENGNVYTSRCCPSNGLKVALLIPPFRLSTTVAREVLPKSYDKKDVIYNLSRAVLTFAALSNNEFELLKYAVGDKMHEPYRRPLMKGFDEAIGLFKQSGAIATYLSGAGPTVAAFVGKDFKAFTPPDGWMLKITDIDNVGTTIKKL